MRRWYWVIFSLLLISGHSAAADNEFLLTILHTNDLHSHFTGNGPDALARKHTVGKGHYARLATAINTIREEKIAAGEPVLLIDSGDFFGGSLFHILGPSEKSRLNPEFEFFATMGYDAVALGNHEFDAYELGLSRMLDKAVEQQFNVPVIAANMVIQKPGSFLEKHLISNVIAPYVIKEVTYQNVTKKIAIMGIVPPNAAWTSTNSRHTVGFVGYDDANQRQELYRLAEFTKREVHHLRTKEQVDFVIVAMHGGQPEDETLLKAIPEIDLVLSGHTHEQYLHKVGTRYLMQNDYYGQTLGKLELALGKRRYYVRNPDQAQVAIDERWEPDEELTERIQEYKMEINRISQQFSFQDYVTSTAQPVATDASTHQQWGKHLATTIREEINEDNAPAIDAYFTVLGFVREGFASVPGTKTSVWFADIFRMLSLGFDSDMQPGVDVATFFLSARELKSLLEFLDVFHKTDPNATPVFSENLTYDIRPWGVPFVNRVQNIRIDNKPLSKHPQLIHIGTNYALARRIAQLPKLSYGLIDITPRNAEGESVAIHPRKDLTKEIIYLSRGIKRRGLL